MIKIRFQVSCRSVALTFSILNGGFNLSFPILPSHPTENLRKPFVSNDFRRIKREYWEEKD